MANTQAEAAPVVPPAEAASSNDGEAAKKDDSSLAALQAQLAVAIASLVALLRGFFTSALKKVKDHFAGISKLQQLRDAADAEPLNVEKQAHYLTELNDKNQPARVIERVQSKEVGAAALICITSLQPSRKRVCVSCRWCPCSRCPGAHVHRAATTNFA